MTGWLCGVFVSDKILAAQCLAKQKDCIVWEKKRVVVILSSNMFLYRMRHQVPSNQGFYLVQKSCCSSFPQAVFFFFFYIKGFHSKLTNHICQMEESNHSFPTIGILRWPQWWRVSYSELPHNDFLFVPARLVGPVTQFPPSLFA